MSRAVEVASCRAVQADETISVRVPIGEATPLPNLGVFACLLGPDLAAAEERFRAPLRLMPFEWVIRSDDAPQPSP